MRGDDDQCWPTDTYITYMYINEPLIANYSVSFRHKVNGGNNKATALRSSSSIQIGFAIPVVRFNKEKNKKEKK